MGSSCHGRRGPSDLGGQRQAREPSHSRRWSPERCSGSWETLSQNGDQMVGIYWAGQCPRPSAGSPPEVRCLLQPMTPGGRAGSEPSRPAFEASGHLGPLSCQSPVWAGVPSPSAPQERTGPHLPTQLTLPGNAEGPAPPRPASGSQPSGRKRNFFPPQLPPQASALEGPAGDIGARQS